MMKYMTLAALFSLLFHAMTLAHEEPAKTIKEKQDKEKEARRIASQKIKSVVATKTVFDTTGKTTASFRYLETEYLTGGYILAITMFEQNGGKKLTVRYEYDLNNNMTVDADYDSSGRITEKAVYSYDDSGRVTGSVNYKENLMDSRFVYERRLSESAVIFYKYTVKDSLEYRIDYYFSRPLNHGLLTDAYKYVPGGDTSVHAGYRYDPSGRVMQKTVYGPKGKLTHRFDYEYDAAGNRTKITKIIPGEITEWFQEFSYDVPGNVNTQIVYDSKRRLISKINFTYIYYK